MTEEGGRFETSSLLRFLTSVSTQFSNSFQNHHNCLPDFNIASLIVVVSLIWMFGFVLNCSVNPEREGWGSRVADQFFKFFIVSSERCQKVHQNFFIFLETSTRSYRHTLSAFVGVIGSER